MDIRNGNCLELMKTLPDKSVDLFVCDLPYGETNCKWDTKIDMVEFWKEFKRIRKSPRTACIHFCSTKFGYTLIKSWEKGFKMDMVWKKRNKTGGLQSRHRPMRNHEMVYFFYDQAPKYNRDKYHKRIQEKLPIIKDDKQIMGKGYAEGQQPPFNSSKYFDPPNPASVVEEKTKKKTIKGKDRKGMGESSGIYAKENQTASSFEPPNPSSVINEKYKMDNPNTGLGYEYGSGWQRDKVGKSRIPNAYEPPNPASVVEEETTYGITKEKCLESRKNGFGTNGFEPPNPASVVEDLIEPAEDEPKSMFESTKVFIGKRNHQTEKPQDILEFFLKYWTDEDQVVCDPTMGSGSTGVACKKLGRKFIGFELDSKIFEVAKKRIEKD
jgi:DNA modification methylase